MQVQLGGFLADNGRKRAFWKVAKRPKVQPPSAVACGLRSVPAAAYWVRDLRPRRAAFLPTPQRGRSAFSL